MRKVYLGMCITLLYMELVYHIASFGMKKINPILALLLILCLSGIVTIASGAFKRKINEKVFWGSMAVIYLIYAAQLVYLSIFQQPMLMAAVVNAGQDALTDFWKEALRGIFHSTGFLVLLALPLVGWYYLQKKRIVMFRRYKKIVIKRTAVVSGASFGIYVVILLIGFIFKMNFYDQYQGFYDPSKVISLYGVLPSVGRDIMGDLLPASTSAMEAMADNSQEEEEKDPEVDTSPNVLQIDFDQLRENADSDLITQLADYMEAMTPTNKNEYTGMFEGYNLIYMTAEGFSHLAVDETLTPTLYKLTHSGFVVEDYYVPLWQTSTSDGEYVNMFGLIPDEQVSFKRSKDNELPYTLARYFEAEGVQSYAYHNNSLTYYNRNETHPNMGYIFKAAKLGKLTQEEGGDMLFDIESASSWPASDLEMIEATISDYINDDRFHAYYMTVSGHMDYTFDANNMSYRNREAVADLPYSEGGKAYIACNMELDKALEYLISELDKAGKLETTVIALSADHYPYGLDIDDMEELAGQELEGTLDLYRNSLILWNSEMGTVEIDKTCSAIDLLPTVLNLFGFEYDSRLYSGKDMLSNSGSMVVFADRSFITDEIEYNSETEEVISRKGAEIDEEYLEQMQMKVRGMFEYAAGILNGDFYKYVDEVAVRSERNVTPAPTKAPEEKEGENQDSEEKSEDSKEKSSNKKTSKKDSEDVVSASEYD